MNINFLLTNEYLHHRIQTERKKKERIEYRTSLMKTMIVNVFKLLLLSSVFLTQYCLAEICSDAIPGFNKMIRGVDITSMDLLPLNGVEPIGVRSPILRFVCPEGYNGITSGSRACQRVDQAWDISVISGSYRKPQITVYENFYNVRKQMQVRFKIGGGYGDFALSDSTSYKNTHNIILTHSDKIEDVSSFQSATEILSKPSWSSPILDTYAEQFISIKLTETYEENPRAYKTFINTFGTHYFTRATLGGLIRSYMVTINKYSSSKTDAQLKAEARALYIELLSSISATKKFTNPATSESSEFKRSTQSTVRYYGGKESLMENTSEFKEWEQSVKENPSLISGELEPIYNLIKNETIKSNVKIATNQHVFQAYISELLQWVLTEKQKYFDLSLHNLLKRIKEQQESDILDLEEITSLKTDLEYHIIIPEWFTKHTQLCLQYRSEKTGHLQCNGNDITEPNELCALPNSYTAVYHDNTARKPGGCVIQWAIRSRNPPTWFYETKICFKWESGTDGIYTCNIGHDSSIGNKVCASVNELTSKYVDKTFTKLNYCKMSWSIQLSDKAPLWQKRSKLCFNWKSDIDNGQCGVGASSTTLCAAPGRWTEWFKDNTQHVLSGGCNYKWSWMLDA